MEKEYLSIKEFAAAVGISQQAVYKQLNNRLKPYLKVVDNKKKIEKSAFELFSAKENLNQVEQPIKQPVEQPLNNPINEKLIEMLQKELELLQKELENKQQEILDKNKHIEELTKSLSEERELVRETLDSLRVEQNRLTLSTQRILELEAAADQEQNQEVEEPVKKKWWQKFF